jgi:hypothetical protein
MTPSDQLWLALLSTPGANPDILACGHPLSGDKQYFDLLSVTEQNGQLFLGHTLATALSEPIIASHVDVKLAPSTSGPVTWTVHSGSCTGSTVASGQFAANATSDGTLAQRHDRRRLQREDRLRQGQRMTIARQEERHAPATSRYAYHLPRRGLL